jgi:hypothetical protein
MPDIPPVAINDRFEHDANSVDVYPNPTHSELFLNIYLKTEDILDLRIYQANGVMIDDIMLGNASAGRNRYNINVDNLNRGYYILHITGNNSVFSDSVIIQ